MKIFSFLFLLSFIPFSYGQQLIPESLEKLMKAGKEAHSNAIVVYKDSVKVAENYFGQKKQKCEAMSTTKFVVGLAIGKAISDGYIQSINTPVWNYYPEWKQGNKQLITIKHLMNHTSGLQNLPNADLEINGSPDFVQLALSAELDTLPGTTYSYNNKATNLLSGIIEKATGEKMDEYISNNLFKPLGIIDFDWDNDPAGTPQGMAGLFIYPDDLARIGLLVLNRGNWKGEQLIKEEWFDLMLNPSQPFDSKVGLLCELIPNSKGQIVGFMHSGWLGQYLIIFPGKKLIGVRMVRYFPEHDEGKDNFQEFASYLYNLF